MNITIAMSSIFQTTTPLSLHKINLECRLFKKD